MKIIEDTRQQAGKHDQKHVFFEQNSIGVLRSKVPFGDYCLPPTVAVDTKASINELAMDIHQEHERFKAEMVTARDYGCRLYILVENMDGVACLEDLAKWTESTDSFLIRMSKNQKAKRFNGLTLSRACRTLSERYGATFEFCSPEQAGNRIMEILTCQHIQTETT